MSDIAQRLRAAAGRYDIPHDMHDEAADEIVRLRDRVAILREQLEATRSAAPDDEADNDSLGLLLAKKWKGHNFWCAIGPCTITVPLGGHLVIAEMTGCNIRSCPPAPDDERRSGDASHH